MLASTIPPGTAISRHASEPHPNAARSVSGKRIVSTLNVPQLTAGRKAPG